MAEQSLKDINVKDEGDLASHNHYEMPSSDCVCEQWGGLRSKVMPNLIMTSLIALFGFTPLLSRLEIPYVKVLLIVLWIVTSIVIKRPSNVKQPRSVVKWWGLYMALVYISCIVGHSSNSLNFFISNLTQYCIPFIMVTVLCKYNLREKKFLWIIIATLIVVNLVQNIFTGLIIPDYFYGLDGIDTSASVKLTNAGGTGMVMQCMFSVVIWTMVFCYSNRKLLSVILVVMCVFYITILNSRTTALLVLGVEVIGLLFVLTGNRVSKISKKKIIFFSLLAIIIISVFFTSIIEELLGVFENSKDMTDRLTDLKSVAEGEDIEMLRDGSLAQRYLLWTTSINTFLASIPNFLFGIGDDFSTYDMAGLLKSGIGRHSEFFDLAAKYGLLGIIIIYKGWRSTFQLLRNICHSEEMKYLLGVFIVAFIIYGFVNLLTPSLFNMVFLPLTLVMLKHQLI